MRQRKDRSTFWETAICTLLAIAIVMAAPSGWLYDLWAGTGTRQGQWPDESVRTLRGQGEVEACFLAGTPVTVGGGTLTPCPLARLRDPREAGVHYKNGVGRRRVYVSEYITASYPLPLWQRVLQGCVGCAYNRYYLMELEDGSHVCVYFDDYLALIQPEQYPTGYLRYSTNEERRMLGRMADDYQVDPVYVLDLYRYGKASWIVDLLLRFGVLFLAIMGLLTLQEHWKKRAAKAASPY